MTSRQARIERDASLTSTAASAAAAQVGQREPREARSGKRTLLVRRAEDAAHEGRRRQRRPRPDHRAQGRATIYLKQSGAHLTTRRRPEQILATLLMVQLASLAAGLLEAQRVHTGASSGRLAAPVPADYFHYYFPPAPGVELGPAANMSPLSQEGSRTRRQPSPPPPPPPPSTNRSQPRQRSQPASPSGPGPAANNQPELEFQAGREPTGAPEPARPVHGGERSSQWIPIVAASASNKPVRIPHPARDAAEPQPSGSTSNRAALLDYPPPPPPPPAPAHKPPQRPHPNRDPPAAAPTKPRHRANGTTPLTNDRAQSVAGNRTQPGPGGRRGRGRGHEIQSAQGSHPHHQNSYPPVHTSHHLHHLHHHHHHHWPPPPPLARRRPRFQHSGEPGPLDNEIGGASGLGPASKMYKRVLLCDKTLVSLDYIRNLEAEPRPLAFPYHDHHHSHHDHYRHKPPPPPPPASIASYQLGEHEIGEISDNFLDLDGNFDSSLSRSSSLSWPPSATPGRSSAATLESNRTTSASDSPARANATAFGDRLPATEKLAANESSAAPAATAISVHLAGDAEDATELGAAERRGHAFRLAYRESLLSDHDPLVRCDMWDLEKGLKSRKPPAHILRMAVKADFDTVRDAINRCRQLSERTLPPEDEYRGDGGLELMSTEDLVSLFSMKRGLMPGTKWCGLGDQAEAYNDLGPKHRIDICCRAHDHCPIRSKPFRNDYGVLNIGLYTKSHCDCDADFYRCLREVRSRTADMLGNLYFNVMKLQCMREERLKVCREMKPLALGFERCVRYEDSPVKTVFKFTTPPVAY